MLFCRPWRLPVGPVLLCFVKAGSEVSRDVRGDPWWQVQNVNAGTRRWVWKGDGLVHKSPTHAPRPQTLKHNTDDNICTDER